MSAWRLILRSLRFYWRTHAGVAAGAAVATAVLVGALVVGDSVRYSLRQMALARLGKTDLALLSPDRFFRAALADEVGADLRAEAGPAILLAGTAARPDGSARANRVQVVGVDGRFWRLSPPGQAPAGAVGDGIVLNDRLAAQLRAAPGDQVVIRVEAPSALPRDAPLSTTEDSSVAITAAVGAVASDATFGRFSLQANQVPPFTAFVPLALLQERLKLTRRANLILLGGPPAGPPAEAAADAAVRKLWRLADADLELRDSPGGGGEIRTARVFLDAPAAGAARAAAPNSVGVLTYFVNEVRHGERATPYSMVTAMDAAPGGVVPAGMADDEIIINDWLAEDLQAAAGDTVELSYYVLGRMRALEVRKARFRVRAVAPLTGAAADRTLMPDFPGLADVENCRDWKPGVDIDLKKIRPKDEEYWDRHRGTPKAFVTLAAGQKMWANRFGDLTAVRYPGGGEGRKQGVEAAIRAGLDPAAAGLFFRPVRAEALAAGSQSLDFGQLFLGFSFFLIVSALLLMGLLFVFGVQQRGEQVGLMLAVGWRAGAVRRVLLGEALVLVGAGVAAGVPAGALYTRAVLHGLATIWSGATGASRMQYHAQPSTLAIAAGASAAAAGAAMWLALWRQVRRPARELLAGEAALEQAPPLGPRKRRRVALWIALGALAGAVAIVAAVGARKDKAAAGAFFGAGALLLTAVLAGAHAGLSRLGRARGAGAISLTGLSLRNAARRRWRSLATVGLLAAGCFLVVAVGANRRDPSAGAELRPSGTGGFALYAESSLPIVHDLNTPAGREALALSDADVTGVSFVQMRVRLGDDASCLNLNRAQTPPLIGVRPEELERRKAFTFSQTASAPGPEGPWSLLRPAPGSPVVPGIADEATVTWAMGKNVGDVLTFRDERGRPFEVRLVGAVAGSILQGGVIIDEGEFARRYPSASGCRMFLIDAPPERAEAVAAALSRAGQDVGLEVTPAARRLAEFQAVENTNLSIFQALGGLGLLLGSIAMGLVVLRNVLERRAELALMRAVGFPAGAVRRMVIEEHDWLLAAGLLGGVAAAAVAVVPALRSPGAHVPYASLTGTLALVLASGLAWTAAAAALALRGRLAAALRNE